ncbi:hypothetical protein T440DRAFT_468556 [Plenodomus tracheiphilus IPT5]|uniref:Uncharacterized protein n=1 Tax=Plenodomus tracheiphilus IPT5 TaxID=1408161 RepID=A0A6A7B5I1_9PLEO|nr:hypothetical protein T440DRAFT_468556 [Plenodomus tracheiphilus IPT5]
MQLKKMELLGFIICTGLFSTLVSLWYTVSDIAQFLQFAFSLPQTPLITDRELTLIFALFSVVSVILVVLVLQAKDVPPLPSDAIHDAHLADANASHHRRINALTSAHATELNELRATLLAANVKFDRLNGDYEWMSNMYQDLMRGNQEQEDRMAYLERKLQEVGRRTSLGVEMPMSAPSAITSFELPPKRESNLKTSVQASPLVKVVEIEE